MNYGIDITKNLLKISLAQSYEFDANSNYNKDFVLLQNYDIKVILLFITELLQNHS